MAPIQNGNANDNLPFEYEKDVKAIADSATAVPSKFNYENDSAGFTADSLPIIDVSAITTVNDSDRRSKAIQGLRKACEDWGFFILVNHGISEDLLKATFNATSEFFALPEEKKKKYFPKSASDPIKCGNFNVSTASNQKFTLWRDYLKNYAHPEFHCPEEPAILREVTKEYVEKSRKLARILMEALAEALELDPEYVAEALDLDQTFQLYASNLYPPCPQPDQTIGLPPHTDHGLLTFLIHNGVAGLQIRHNGTWFNADSPKNSILVNVADQLEIFSNGRFKSVMHRAVVNSEKERISIVVPNGPSLKANVGPADALVKREGRALYKSMNYEEYVEAQLTRSSFGGKTILEQQMIPASDN